MVWKVRLTSYTGYEIPGMKYVVHCLLLNILSLKQGTGGKPQNIQVLRTVLGQSTGKPGQTTYVITQAGLEQSPEGNQGTGEQKTKTGKQNKPGS